MKANPRSLWHVRQSKLRHVGKPRANYARLTMCQRMSAYMWIQEYREQVAWAYAGVLIDRARRVTRFVV